MTSQEAFREALKARRIAMGPGNRAKTKSPTFKTSWIYPSAIERKYAKAISKIQREYFQRFFNMLKEDLPRWIESYKNDSAFREDATEKFREDSPMSDLKTILQILQKYYDKLYGGNAPIVRALVTGIGSDTSAFNYKQHQKFIKLVLGVEFSTLEPWEQEVIQNWGDTNFGLIQNLTDEGIKYANTVISEGLQYGMTYDEIARDLKKKFSQLSGYRSRFLARDQIGKLNGLTTKRRMEDAGIEMYRWVTVGDERVRGNPNGPFKNAVPSHYVMPLGDKLYRWDNSNVYSSDYGKTWKNRTGLMSKSFPGMDILCRCTSIPYFDAIIEEIDDEILQEAA